MRDEPLRYEVIDRFGEVGRVGVVLARFDKLFVAEVFRSKMSSMGVPTTITDTEEHI